MKTYVCLILLFLSVPVMADSTFTIGAGTADANQSVYLQGTAKRVGTTHLYVGDTCASQLQTFLISWAAVADSFNKGVPVYCSSCTLLVKTQATTENYQGYIRMGQILRTWYQDTATSVNYDTTHNWTTTYARSIGGVNPDIDTTGSGASEMQVSEMTPANTWIKIPCTGVVQDGMDGADSAAFRKGVMIYAGGPWNKQGAAFSCAGYGFDFGSVDFYKHNATTAGNRPQIKISYTKAVTPPVSTTVPRRRRIDANGRQTSDNWRWPSQTEYVNVENRSDEL